MPRTQYDDLNANDLPDEAGTLVAVYPDHPEATNPGRVFANARVVTITVKAGGSAKGYMVADVGDVGDYTPATFAAEVVAAHGRGNDVFSGYWDDAIDAQVRAALVAAGVTSFNFSTRRWRAAWLAPGSPVPTTVPAGCVAWQWTNGAGIGQPYDQSIVADTWPAVDTPWQPPIPVPAPPAPAPPPPADTYTVTQAQPGYVTSADAAAERNSNSTVPPGTYDIQNRALGMVALYQHDGAPGWWINPAQGGAAPVPAPPAPAPAPNTYTVTRAQPGYVNSEDAAASRNSNSTVPPGTYSVQNRALGMVALYQHDGAPGWWINPSQS